MSNRMDSPAIGTLSRTELGAVLVMVCLALTVVWRAFHNEKTRADASNAVIQKNTDSQVQVADSQGRMAAVLADVLAEMREARKQGQQNQEQVLSVLAAELQAKRRKKRR